MGPFIRFTKKVWILLYRRRFLNELDEEMAFHRSQAEKEFVAEGMTPQAARQAAMRQFGNAMKLREQSHRAVAFRMETVVQDLRFAFRRMLRAPGFAITAVLTLTLGIAANVIVFGVLQALVLRPLDVPDAEKSCPLCPAGTAQTSPTRSSATSVTTTPSSAPSPPTGSWISGWMPMAPPTPSGVMRSVVSTLKFSVSNRCSAAFSSALMMIIPVPPKSPSSRGRRGRTTSTVTLAARG